MKHYLYKITNNFDNMIYIGIHSTCDLNDGYMGSGIKLCKAQNKYGIEKFTKSILYRFKNRFSLELCESIIVDKYFIQRTDTYNQTLGGQRGWFGMASVKDKSNNIIRVSLDDPRYLNGEFVGVQSKKVTVKDKSGNTMSVSVNDPRYLSGELVHHTQNLVPVKDKSGNTFSVNKLDPRYLSGELVPMHKGLIIVKDKNNIISKISKSDLRYKSGELVAVNKGIKQKPSEQIICQYCNKSFAKRGYGRHVRTHI